MPRRLRQAFEEDDAVFASIIIGVSVLSTVAMISALFW